MMSLYVRLRRWAARYMPDGGGKAEGSTKHVVRTGED